VDWFHKSIFYNISHHNFFIYPLKTEGKISKIDFCIPGLRGKRTRTKQIVGNTCWPSETGVNQFVMRRILIREYIGEKQTK